MSALVNSEIITNEDDSLLYQKGLTEEKWLKLQDEEGRIKDVNYLLKLVYFGYCEPVLRSKVWPYLLGHYDFNLTKEQREQQDEEMKQNYELIMTEWLAVEAIVKIRDKENLTASLAKFNSSEEHRTNSQSNGNLDKDQLDDVFRENDKVVIEELKKKELLQQEAASNSKENKDFLIEKLLKDVIEEDENCDECKFEEEENDDDNSIENSDSRCSSALKLNNLKRQRNVYTQLSTQSSAYATNQILITDASVDLCRNTSPENKKLDQTEENDSNQFLGRINVDSRNDGQLSADHSREHSTCVSPASSNGGVYTVSYSLLFSLFLLVYKL